MKLNKFITAALAAVALGVVAVPTASAQITTWTPGDMILGFQTTGAGSNNVVLFNIGSAITYRDATTTFSLGLTGLDAALDATFGSDWNTRSDVYWGIAGTRTNAAPSGLGSQPAVNGEPGRTFYATNDNNGQAATSFSVGSATAQTQVVNDMLGTFNNYNGRASFAGTGNRGAIIGTSSTSVGWEDFNTLSTPVGSFGDLPSIQGNFGNGASGTTLDLYRVLSSTTGANPTGPVQSGTYEGTFSITDTGDVSFAAVPEPSTYAFMALGALVLAAAVRRRHSVKA